MLALTVSIFAGCSGGGNEGGNGGGTSVVVTPPEKVTNETYQSYWMKQFDYKTMPVAAFNGAPPKILDYKESLITDAHYKTLSEAYFNTNYALYDRTADFADDVKESLRLAEKYNISYLAIDTSFPTASNENILENAICSKVDPRRSAAL